MRIATLLLLATACGSDGGLDLVGLYQTSSDLASATACTGGTAPADAPPYFRIAESNFLGAKLHDVKTCTGTDAATCSDSSFFSLLTVTDADGYHGDATVASGDATSCNLEYIQSSAKLAGEVLTYRVDTFGADGLVGVTCTTDEAGKRGTTMPCKNYQELVGMRVAAP